MKAINIMALAIALAGTLHLSAQKITGAEYIERYKGIAVSHAEKYGIPASIKMAQGMLESGNGNSRLATEANNHFGIKCKTGWTGRSLHHDDDEKNECFRAYSSAEESWADHSEFLDKGARYQFLFDLDPADYKAWARGLKEAGYATNPLYPELLIRIIEDNELYLLDRGADIPYGTIIAREDARDAVSAEVRPASEGMDPDHYTIAMHTVGGREIYSMNGHRFVVAREGDTLASIAEATGIRPRRLARINRIGPRRPATYSKPLTTGQHIKIG